MATKIDLLPGYVKLTKRFHFTIGCAIVGLALWTGGLLLVYHSKQLELATARQNQSMMQPFADQKTAADTARDAALAAAGGYRAANSFMLASTKTGSERAALVNLLSKYIYEDSVVRSIDISDGQNVNIVATVATPDDYAAFLRNLRQATGVVFASDPRLSGVGGFANGATPLVLPDPEPGSAPVVINYPITLSAQGVLLHPIPAVPDPTGGAAGTAPGGLPQGLQ